MQRLSGNHKGLSYAVVLLSVFFTTILVPYLSAAQVDDTKCRNELERLFTFADMGEIRLGNNCHPPAAGCIGCAEEVITITGRPIVSFTSRIISIVYHVERIHVWGECPGPVKWDHRPDPEGPIDARLEISFRVQNGRLVVGDMSEVRSKAQDTRPSWAKSRLESMVRAKSGTPVDCRDTD
jgi:hypothetical protein